MSGQPDSDEEDEWGTEELIIPDSMLASKRSHQAPSQSEGDAAESDEPWQATLPPSLEDPQPKVQTSSPSLSSSLSLGEPMILVDVTLFDASIHCRFDAHGVSDSQRASEFRRRVELNYGEYRNNADYLAEGSVVPCSTSVWQVALQQLRHERPGHYLAPIFPPSTKQPNDL